MSETHVKICGITRAEDALYCAARGADFLGFVFVEESPRNISPDHAARIIEQVRREGVPTQFVGVFRDASPEYVREVASSAALDVVQLHGNETDDVIEAIGLPVIKARRILDALPDVGAHPSAQWLLFDTHDERRAGGTGRRFDWSLLHDYDRSRPFFLSGGLNAENVGAAISLVRPDGIDLSSGVESEPGIKDRGRIDQLFERVRRIRDIAS